MEPTTAAMAAAYGYNYFHDQNEVRYLVLVLVIDTYLKLEWKTFDKSLVFMI